MGPRTNEPVILLLSPRWSVSNVTSEYRLPAQLRSVSKVVADPSEIDSDKRRHPPRPGTLQLRLGLERYAGNIQRDLPESEYPRFRWLKGGQFWTLPFVSRLRGFLYVWVWIIRVVFWEIDERVSYHTLSRVAHGSRARNLSISRFTNSGTYLRFSFLVLTLGLLPPS